MLPVEILDEDVLLKQRIKYPTGGAFWHSKEQKICGAWVNLKPRQFLQGVVQPAAFCANYLGLVFKPISM